MFKFSKPFKLLLLIIFFSLMLVGCREKQQFYELRLLLDTQAGSGDIVSVDDNRYISEATESYAQDEEVKLRASAGEGRKFVGWNLGSLAGQIDSFEPEISLTMSQDKTVKAVFASEDDDRDDRDEENGDDEQEDQPPKEPDDDPDQDEPADFRIYFKMPSWGDGEVTISANDGSANFEITEQPMELDNGWYSYGADLADNIAVLYFQIIFKQDNIAKTLVADESDLAGVEPSWPKANTSEKEIWIDASSGYNFGDPGFGQDANRYYLPDSHYQNL